MCEQKGASSCAPNSDRANHRFADPAASSQALVFKAALSSRPFDTCQLSHQSGVQGLSKKRENGPEILAFRVFPFVSGDCLRRG